MLADPSTRGLSDYPFSAEEKFAGQSSGPDKSSRATSDSVLGIPDDIWRSAVLPGWGQMRNGRESAGRRFMVGFLSGLGVNLLLLHDHRLKKKEHDFASTRLVFETPFFSGSPSLPVFVRNFQDANRTRSRLETSSRRVNVAFTLLLGLYGWNLADAWWFYKQRVAGLNIEVAPEQVRVSMGFRF